LQDKIEFVKAVKKFGEVQLHLRFDGSFEELATDDFSCNWVYACKKDKMESVAENNRPFEFYSDINKALKRQKEFAAQGFDTYFYHAEAHGGKKCPITREMLESDRARQCYVILHEAWHSTSRLHKHNFLYPFEESTGRVVGLFGGIEFARYLRDDELLKSTTDQEAAWSILADFVNDSWNKLNELMDKQAPLQEIEKLKEELNYKAQILYQTMPDSWEKIELNKPVNNAFILRYHDYTVYYPLAKAIFLEDSILIRAMQKYVERAPILNMCR